MMRLSTLDAPGLPARWATSCLGALLTIGLAILPGLAQEPKSGDAPKAGASAPKADEKAKPADEAPAEEAKEPEAPDTVFVDPLAQQALDVDGFPQLFARAPNRPTDQEIDKMARGDARPDPALIAVHIEAQGKALTDHRNIMALTDADGPVNETTLRAIERAGKSLLAPLAVPPDARNAAFRRAYVEKLLAVAPELLKNHLYARTQTMLALSRAGDPRAIDLFAAQLDDPDQLVMVKLLAATGIANVARQARDLSVDQQARAARALTKFLNDNPDTFWLARVRALEALGSVRLAADIEKRSAMEMASTALGMLADPELRPEVRAWAGWSLGMLDLAGPPAPNLSLIAYHEGLLAVEIASEIGELAPAEGSESIPARVRALTGLLVQQIFGGLNGEADLRNSGLVNSRSIEPHRAYVRRIHGLVRQLGVSAITLTRAVGNQRGQARQDVLARTEELRKFLAENPPKDMTLIPGGPTFAAPGERVAAGQ